MWSSQNPGNFSNSPMSIPRSGLKRPAWPAPGKKQLVILDRDASGSMAGTKLDDASRTSRELVEEGAQPSNLDGFLMATIDFAGTARLVHDVTPASSLAAQYAPLKLMDGGTNITAALELTRQIIDRPEFENHNEYLRPVVLAFTDGGHNVGCNPTSVASELKRKADLVTVAFGTDACETLLKELATSAQHFYRCRNGAELRAFFGAAARTLTVSLQRQQNATQALTRLRLQ